METLYTLSPRALWSEFRKQSFAFWMMCLYLVLQYFDPLRIYHSLSFLPLDKVAIGLAILTLPLDPKRRWARDSTNVWMIFFWLVTVVSSVFAIYPSVSWSHWFDFFNWLVIYFVIINTVNTAERYFIFLVIFLLANFKLSFFGARTWAERGFGFATWGLEGPPGFFQNSADFSGEMLMFAPVAFELARFVKPYVRRVTYWFLMLGAISGGLSILGSSDRGSQLAMACQGAWMAIQRRLKFKVLVGIALLAGVGFALLPAAEKARFTRSGTDRTSIQRLNYWKAGLKMIENHPVLGVGYFNFAPVYAVHDPNELWSNGKAQLPHNIFIQVATDAGLFGLAIFLVLIYRNLKIAREIQRTCKDDRRAPAFASSVARGLSVTTLGFVVAGQFNTVTYYPFLWINLALTVSLANIVRVAVEQRVESKLVPQSRERCTQTSVDSGPTQGKLASPRNLM
jgi:O-antigen ligase